MRKLLYIFLLIFLSSALQAQEILEKGDSLLAQTQIVADSLLDFSAIESSPQQVKDSIHQLIAVSDTLRLKRETDSLRQIAASIDTLKLKKSLDSLQQLRLPLADYQAREDSIRNALDISARASQKIQSIEEQLNRPLAEERQQLQEKTNNFLKPEGLNQEAVGKLEEQTGVALSKELPGLEGVSLEEIDLPATDLPAIEGVSVDGMKGLKIPEASLPDLKLPELEEVKLDGVSENLNKLGKLKVEVDQYSKDVSSLSQGKWEEVKNVDELAEQKIMEREEMGIFQTQAAEAKLPADQLLQQQKEDYLKQKATEEAEKVVLDHFSGQKEKLNTARAKLNKYKGRYQEVKSVKELPKNPLLRNPLKGKPWQERFVVGSIWQFYKEEGFKMDLGPSLAYRITDKLELGAAYQWRLTVDKKAALFLSTSDWLSGYSIFTDYKIKKGFFIRGALARLSLLPMEAGATDQGHNRTWVNNWQLGAGKSYTFYKSIKGYSIIQYSFSKGWDTPYKNPIQVKIGFYMIGKRFRKLPQNAK
jgi:hypothetical protein